MVRGCGDKSVERVCCAYVESWVIGWVDGVY